MDGQSQSPTRQKEMDFPDALRQVKLGKKITKLEWGDKDIYGFMNDNILSLHKTDGVNYKWIINDGDLMGEDWITI